MLFGCRDGRLVTGTSETDTSKVKLIEKHSPGAEFKVSKQVSQGAGKEKKTQLSEKPWKPS